MPLTEAKEAGSTGSEWDERVRIPGTPEREMFVLAHTPLVRYVALRIVGRLRPPVDVTDLINDGLVGLIQAIERFDSSRGVQFRSFAEMRVRGAMLDALRRSDLVSRRLRRRIREMGLAAARCEQRLGRPPGEREVAEELGVEPEEVAELRMRREMAQPAVAEPRWADPLGEAAQICPDPTPLEQVMSTQLQERLADLVTGLPARERLILGLYYEDGLTLREVGEVLEVTESRVCQLHSRIVKQLGRKLRDSVSGRGGTKP